MRSLLIAFSLIVCSTGCNGGGGSSDGTIVQGVLTERGTGHASADEPSSKHSAGQQIEEVKVCVRSECSITDGAGQWGVNLDNFTGGEVEILVDGHGINSSTKVSLPPTAKEVELNLAHNKNTIAVEKLIIDGEDHTGHDHSHS